MINDLSPLWISLKTAFTATLITFFLGVLAARFAIRHNGRFSGIIDGLLTLPLVLPPTVVGFFLLLVFGKNGPIGSFLSTLGIRIIFSWPATVLASAVVAFPLMYSTTKAALKQVDSSFIDDARILGATEWKIFWSVSVPIAWPGIAAGTVLAFARSLGEFGATLMIAGSIPGKTQTIPTAIFFAVEGGEMHKALVWVLLVIGISLGAMVVMNYCNNYQNKLLKSTGGRQHTA